MTFYDIDGDGNITYEEFLRGLKDPLTERKQNMVDKAWRLLDRDGSGVATVSDIAHLYDVTNNKDF